MDSFFKNFKWASEDSFDSLFGYSKKEVRKISSLLDLSGFIRISETTLINKAQRDLWRIGKDDGGDLVIFRLFDSNDDPIKG